MALTSIFNLYDLFVNLVFGDVWFALFGLMAIFGLIGLITRMSPMLIMFLLAIFFAAYTSLIGNAIGLFVLGTISIGWLINELKGWWEER